jgi:ATP/maltotriose-dependent transcriptional regulator MalT/DNA-binding SARP family transcriptional activator
MPISIIPTKIIIPKRQPGIIRRARLIDDLHENLPRKLMLITAPAGYGKTTLLVDFASDAGLPVCWYTLDEGDRDPSTFLAHLLASIRQKFPQFGQHTQPLSEHGVESTRAVAAALVADMLADIPEYFALILDDWHLVSDEAVIRDLVDQLLRYLPEHAHLIVAGRALLRGPLVRLAAQGAVAGLGPNDLRFDGDEVREVLARKYALDITPDQAAQLAQEAEGWITAILLRSQSVWHSMLAGLSNVKETAGTFFEYLAGEVFDRLETPLRQFLLDSAVPRQFTAALCDDLRGRLDSAAWIEQIEARNLFLTRVEAEGASWYRYHHLFREFLQTRFKRDDSAGFARQHLRVGTLYEARGQSEEAVEHYLAGAAIDQAARVMNELARGFYIAGRVQMLQRWAEMLPPDYRGEVPDLMLYHGQVLGDRGQITEALPLLQAAEAAYLARSDRVGLVRTGLAQGWAYYTSGQLLEALQAGQAATGQLGDMRVADETLQAQALRLVGASFNLMGQWPQAEQYLSQALALYRLSPSGERRAYDLGRTLQDLANTLRAMGHLEEAAILQTESLGLWREIGNPASLAYCLNNIGYDRYVAGDYEGALSVYAEALAKADEAADRRTQALVLDGLAATYRDRGEFERALETYAQVFSLTGLIGDQSLVSWALDGLGHVHRLTNDFDRALALFDQARSIASRSGNGMQVSLSTASIGITKVEQGEAAQGLADLNQAVAALREANAYLDLARVLLWLAQAQQLAGNSALAQEILGEMARLGHRLGCRPFSLAEGRRALSFLRWGVDQLSTDQRLHGWVNEIQVTTAPSPEVRSAPAPLPRIEARAFGTGQVWRDGQLLTANDWGRSADARELFFFLLEHSPSRKEEIGVQCWPNLSTARMNSAFHVAKYRARRALGVEFDIYDHDLYRINPVMPLWYDVTEFKRLIRLGRESSDELERSLAWQQAVELYTDDYLVDVDAEWSTHAQTSLRLQFFETLKLLVQAVIRQERYDQVIQFCQLGLRFDRFDEDLHRGLMVGLAASGHANEALAHYERTRRRFLNELNTSFTPETRALARRIRSGHATTNALHSA